MHPPRPFSDFWSATFGPSSKGATWCELGSVDCGVWSVECGVWSVECSEQWTVESVQCEMCYFHWNELLEVYRSATTTWSLGWAGPASPAIAWDGPAWDKLWSNGETVCLGGGVWKCGVLLSVAGDLFSAWGVLSPVCPVFFGLIGDFSWSAGALLGLLGLLIFTQEPCTQVPWTQSFMNILQNYINAPLYIHFVLRC